MLSMIIDSAGIDENGVSVKESFGDIDLILELVDRENDILEYLFRESHGPNPWCRRELEEGWFGRKEPSEEETENGMISKWDHTFHNPENSTIVTKEIIS